MTRSTGTPWPSSTSATTSRTATWRRLGARRRPGVQPVAQLALLGPGQLGHLGGVAGLALDQGEGLQHRVVQVRRDLGPLDLAHPQRPLALEVAPQPQAPRGEDQADAQQHRQRRDRDRHEVAGPGPARDQQQDADDGQHDAAAEAQQADPLRAAGRRQPAGPLADVQLPQRHSGADQQDEQRHPDLGVQVEPGPGQQQARRRPRRPGPARDQRAAARSRLSASARRAPGSSAADDRGRLADDPTGAPGRRAGRRSPAGSAPRAGRRPRTPAPPVATDRDDEGDPDQLAPAGPGARPARARRPRRTGPGSGRRSLGGRPSGLARRPGRRAARLRRWRHGGRRARWRRRVAPRRAVLRSAGDLGPDRAGFTGAGGARRPGGSTGPGGSLTAPSWPAVRPRERLRDRTLAAPETGPGLPGREPGSAQGDARWCAAPRRRADLLP